MVEVIMIEPDITEEENNMVWMNVKEVLKKIAYDNSKNKESAI